MKVLSLGQKVVFWNNVSCSWSTGIIKQFNSAGRVNIQVEGSDIIIYNVVDGMIKDVFDDTGKSTSYKYFMDDVVAVLIKSRVSGRIHILGRPF